MSDDLPASHPVDPREEKLLALALKLGAEEFGGPLSDAETELVRSVVHRKVDAKELALAAGAIEAGRDPLGECFSQIRSPARRRPGGVFYTPAHIVEAMVEWIMRSNPERIYDAGCGSGRFAASLARRNSRVDIFAVDIDPFQTLMARAALSVLGAERVTVVNTDFLSMEIASILGRTGYVGNPPYIRHHALGEQTKAWAKAAASRLGIRVSTLAGMHVYFYLATAIKAKAGDTGCFVTSSEWLDVNYGAALRQLFVSDLGGQSLHLIDPQAVPFADAMTTAVIGSFEIGSPVRGVRLRALQRVEDLVGLDGGHEVDATTLRRANRWTLAVNARIADNTPGTIQLGAVARVHRGLVTGANDFFLLTRHRAANLGIQRWCRPAITSAQEILGSNGVVRDSLDRLLLLDVPKDIDRAAFPDLDAYLTTGETAQDGLLPIARRYVPAHRQPWWYLGRQVPAPIVASYMARQAPHFALNADGLAIVNVAHGIYPYWTMSAEQLQALVAALDEHRATFRGNGRTYHGGLEKFEPREMEALRIPRAALAR